MQDGELAGYAFVKPDELAERVSPALSVTTIGNIERGRTRPYRHTLVALGVALALTPEEQAAALEAWRLGTQMSREEAIAYALGEVPTELAGR